MTRSITVDEVPVILKAFADAGYSLPEILEIFKLAGIIPRLITEKELEAMWN